MARTRGSKHSKSVTKGNDRANGPTSADAKKTQTIDEVTGIGLLDVSDPESIENEGMNLSPKSSIAELKKQDEEKQLFSEWLNVINSGAKSGQQVDCGFNGETSRLNGNVVSMNDSIIGDMNTPKEQQISTENVAIPEIDWGDIEEEVNYWGSSIVYFVLGANPPFHVIEGYLRRIWGRRGIDKVPGISNGVFLVRFELMAVRDEILAEECQFFDGKPLITQAWEPDVDWSRKGGLNCQD